MIGRMKCRFLFLLGFLGIAACHGDSHLATDIDAALLQTNKNLVMVPVTIQGTVQCGNCEAENGMAIVVSSLMSGDVANGKFDAIGAYQLTGSAKAGDTLTIKIVLTKSYGVTGKSATASVPDGGGTIQQDFNFQ